MKVYTLYKELLRTGDLFDMYQGLTGNWKEDKESFIKQQTDLENITIVDEEFID